MLEFATELNSDPSSSGDSQILLTIVHPPSQEPVHHQAVSESAREPERQAVHKLALVATRGNHPSWVNFRCGSSDS